VTMGKIARCPGGALLTALRTAIVGRLPLLLILLLAFALRLLSARFLMGSIDSEGAEYARIAENLLNGNGYVGIAIPGTELMFPPLFPLLIAAVSLLTHQSELAGRLISVIMGTLLVLPIYFITLHLYNRRVAHLAALLAACHPLLVGFASTVFSETIYMTFVLSGAYWSLRCLSGETARAFVLAGGFFGLAYLTRQEAALCAFVTIVVLVACIVVINRRQIRQVVLRSCLLLSTFLILGAPYVVWLSAETGQFRWEAKTSINLAVAVPAISGSNVDQVTWGISSDLSDVGVYNRSNLSVIASTKTPLWEIVHVGLANGLHNLSTVPRMIFGGAFASPLLVALVVLGLFGRPWKRALTISQCYLLIVVLGVPCLALAGSSFVDTRYLIHFLPAMIIWAANGIALLSQWGRMTMRLAGLDAPIARRSGIAVGLTSGALLVMIASHGVRNVWDLTTFDYNSQPVKQAGRWLDAFAPGPKTVMDASTIVAFHAGASFIGFPYADGSLALKYIDKKRVDFIVLRDDWLSTMPYVKDWLENGIPDRRAQLIYCDKTQRGRIMIYRWNAKEAGEAEILSEIVQSSDHRSFPSGSAFELLHSATATGPLKVNPINRRYFTDATGRSILLAGSHTWSNFQDAGPFEPPTKFDFETYLRFLREHKHNFMRLWRWEEADWAPWRPYHYRFVPSPYLRPGPGDALDGKPKFDLTKYDESFFDRLRGRIIQAEKQGVYVSVMLFNSVESKGPNDWEDPWRGHPYNGNNNINGINGGPGTRGDGASFHILVDPTIIGYQEDYIRKVVDTVGDLDNVLFEICNECNKNSTDWQYHMIKFIKAYEATKPKQHPVGMTVTYPGGANDTVLASPADWVSINQVGGYDSNPPPADGTKVIIADTDHIWGIGGDRKWVWKSFLRGLNPIFMDPYDNNWMFPPRPPSEDERWESLRRNMGYALTYANRMDLSVMTPRGDLASSGFCLAGFEGSNGTFLVYLPNGGTTTVDLTGAATEMSVEWLDPKTGTVSSAGTIMGGTRQSFSAPFGDDAVLYIRSRTGGDAMGDDVRRIQGAGYR
jgi:4-amino-4-deoxy-L-arabinose transferase-like glycosyltransferase